MKIFKYLFVVMIATVCSAAFTACSSDDDEEETTTEKVSEFKYSFALNEDILSVADVTINYIDTDGNEKSESVSSTSWSKTFTADKFDVSAGVAISMKLKNGAELSKESYRIEYAFSYSAKSMENGKVIDQKGNSISQGMTVKADNVQALLERKSGCTALMIDAAGKISKTTLSWQNNGVNDELELIP